MAEEVRVMEQIAKCDKRFWLWERGIVFSLCFILSHEPSTESQ